MKKIILAIFLVFVCHFFAIGQTFCLNFAEVSNNGTEYVIDLQIAGSAPFGLGSSNFEFTYNNNGLVNPTLVSTAISTPTFQNPTLTTFPPTNRVSFNVELNFAPEFSVGNVFSSMARVKFDIIDAQELSGLAWRYNGGTTATVAFLDDDFTSIYATTNNAGCIIPLSVSLPVELLRFEVKEADQDALLSWETQSETNFSHYEIQRSADQRTWVPLGKVPGQGNAQATVTYRWIDEGALQQKGSYLYYRLKMVDVDDTYRYSPIRSVKLTGLELDLVLFPNPVRDTLNIRLDGEHSQEPVVIDLLDSTGRLVLKQNYPSAGQIAIEVAHLPAGVYSLRVWQEERSQRIAAK